MIDLRLLVSLGHVLETGDIRNDWNIFDGWSGMSDGWMDGLIFSSIGAL